MSKVLPNGDLVVDAHMEVKVSTFGTLKMVH